MNGVMAGVVAGVMLLIAAVVGVMASNNWGQSQQQSAQTYTATQLSGAESSLSTSSAP
ncbi:hypothetical protein [Alicyclobacillus sp. ALC3]|uniref:hypothetical protein n=1 Tax=Alicyclobacillus sp. ALC3 TaxID=2796143 RepID=UPI002377EACC|nr:hypothetical protein [Alicyclobacillus sp. ALC3]WDL99806.1 hypothetical protein JC200_23840 [Alicyclobacillus sp. ALC3]